MPKTARVRIGIGLATAAAVVVGGAGLLMFGWMIDETHFDRPTEAFDVLGEDAAAVPGVRSVDKERWVEAPAFSDPSSSVIVRADAAAFPLVREVACRSAYTDAVLWGFELETAAGTQVSLFSERRRGCPELGFDAHAVVAELDELVPGIRIHASLDDERLALASFDDGGPAGIAELVPLVSSVDAVRAAAGLPGSTPVQVSAALLAVRIGPGETAEYEALLDDLVHRYEATGFFAGGDGLPTDGVEKVQVTAPREHHAGIRSAIETSGLAIAALPVVSTDPATR